MSKKIDIIQTSLKLDKYINTNGLTANKIGEMLDVSYQAVYKWISPSDNTLPTVGHLVTLSGIFNVPVDDLIVSIMEEE